MTAVWFARAREPAAAVRCMKERLAEGKGLNSGEGEGKQSMYSLSFMVTKFKENNKWVLYNWYNTANVTIGDTKHPMYVILENNTTCFAPFLYEGSPSDFDYLVEEFFLVNNQDTVRDLVVSKYNTTTDKKNLSLTLLPVEQECNFNCVYCSQQHQAKSRMGATDIAILEEFLSKQELRTLRIDYFGGEPLLNTDFIIQCNKMATELSRKRGFEFIGSSITTNGYLLSREMFKQLIDLRVTSYQITLDGLPELHDTLRPLSNGGPTFDVIYNNLLEMASTSHDLPFSVTIRFNFNYDTLDDLHRAAFFDKMKRFAEDKRFLIMPQAIGNWKNEVNEKLYCESSQKTLLQYRCEDELEGMGFYTVSTVLHSELDAHSCYSSKPNNLVIFPYSQSTNAMKVHKCTLAMESKENNVGQITEKGELVFNGNIDIWVKNELFRKEKCKNCFLVLHCFSNSCPFTNWQANDVVCPPAKAQEEYLAKRILRFIAEHPCTSKKEN